MKAIMGGIVAMPLGVVCLPTGSPAIQKFVYKPKHGGTRGTSKAIVYLH